MDSTQDRLVSVFKTDDPGLLPLAKIALESAGIEYQARSAGKVDNMQWTLSQKPTIRPTVTEILVASDVAAQATDLLADLNASATYAASDPAVLTDSAESQSIRLEVVTTGILLANLTEAELQELGSHLEEAGQQQYLIDLETITRLRRAGADAELLQRLDAALGDSESITIRWVVGI